MLSNIGKFQFLKDLEDLCYFHLLFGTISREVLIICTITQNILVKNEISFVSCACSKGLHKLTSHLLCIDSF